MDKTSFGDRMKSYEKSWGGDAKVLPNTPVIIRVDGKAFHTFTKKINPESDPSSKYGPSEFFNTVMSRTTQELLKQIQNAVFAYHQSDEISILLRDWDTPETQQWFNGKIQKMQSVSASIATAMFNYHWAKVMCGGSLQIDQGDLAFFDSRVFQMPHHEVANYFIWRQKDASRNSVNFIARKYFSHKQLHGKNINQVQDMLMKEHGINWNDYDTWKKRGACCYYSLNDWNVKILDPDFEVPIFTQDREYVEKHLWSQ